MLNIEEIAAISILAIALVHFYIVYLQSIEAYESSAKYVEAQLKLNNYMQLGIDSMISLKEVGLANCGVESLNLYLQKGYIYRISSGQNGTFVVYCNESANIS
jgi:uncharacterized membrane protein